MRHTTYDLRPTTYDPPPKKFDLAYRRVFERNDVRSRPVDLERFRALRLDRRNLDGLAADHVPALVEEVDLERERTRRLGLIGDLTAQRDLVVAWRELVERHARGNRRHEA